MPDVMAGAPGARDLTAARNKAGRCVREAREGLQGGGRGLRGDTDDQMSEGVLRERVGERERVQAKKFGAKYTELRPTKSRESDSTQDCRISAGCAGGRECAGITE